MRKLFRKIGYGVADALFGSHCRVCGRPVSRFHPGVCEECWATLPRMITEEDPCGPMSQQFLTDPLFMRAASLFRYSHGGGVASMLHDIKYHGCRTLGLQAGRYAAPELMARHLLDGIDAIVPIPVHRLRYMRRGYNQAEVIARGISEVSGVPVVGALVSVRSHVSQTRNAYEARLSNLRGAFRCVGGMLHPPMKIVLFDDVFTTGATMKAAAEVISESAGVRYSILTLAAASGI